MEIFKEIQDYNGQYKVSNLGNVISLKGRSERYLKPRLVNGYKYVTLSNDGIPTTRTVHSLVAEVFLNHNSNESKMVIDHKDNNRLNNSVDNLQIVTQRLNTSKDKKGYTSNYTGVYFHKRDKKWVSTININGKSISLGYFDTELRASTAYELALLQLDKLKKIIS